MIEFKVRPKRSIVDQIIYGVLQAMFLAGGFYFLYQASMASIASGEKTLLVLGFGMLGLWFVVSGRHMRLIVKLALWNENRWTDRRERKYWAEERRLTGRTGRPG
jgi:hypothetical protein